MYSVCFLSDESLLVGAVYENGAFLLYVIDPVQLSFTEIADTAHISSPFSVNPRSILGYE